MTESSKDYFDSIGDDWDGMRESFFSDRVRSRALAAAGVEQGRVAADLGAGTGFITEMEALLDSVYEQYVAGIRASRGKSPDETQAAIDAGPYDGETALAAGLVDELIYADELRDRLKDSESVTPGRYAKGSSQGFGFDRRPKIALVYAVGEIVGGESQGGPLGGQVAGSDTVAAALKEAREDDSVQAIVLRVDSPGGSGTASDVIWREVVLARKAKPVVVSMGDMAASGGYYIAMAADAIVAQPSTITGSIGVFGGKFTLRGLYDKMGISKEILTRGRHADLFTEYRPWDDEERAKFRGIMVSFYEGFIEKAAEGRKKSYQDVDAVAQGRVWTGTEALRHGLVDKLGGLDVAVGLAKERAKIAAGQDIHLVVLPERKGLLETILERQEEEVGARAMLPRELRDFLRWARVLGDGQLVARLPFDLQIR
jgi:protease-4